MAPAAPWHWRPRRILRRPSPTGLGRTVLGVSAEAGTDPEPPGYEQTRAELERVVRQLEQGSATLEQTLALWERGEQLATICETWLEGAQARLAEAQGPDAAEPGD